MRWHAGEQRGGMSGGMGCARGFTLIELVVVVGVGMIVLGLALPSLARAKQLGVASRMSLTVRSNAQMLVVYGSAHRDSFPAYGRVATEGMMDWMHAMVAGGVMESVHESDPDGYAKLGIGRVGLSGAALYESSRMVPGMAQHANEAKIAGVRQAEVLFPSEKGILGQYQDVAGESHVFWSYVPWNPPRWPMAMGDGSVIVAACTDFVLEHDFFEYWVGHPVFSTWSGVKGRDVRR